jgi:hypothetical protein
MSDLADDPVITFMAGEPGMAERILAEHVDDGTGHCAGCTWNERARPVVPCLTRHYAELAVQHGRRRGARSGAA